MMPKAYGYKTTTAVKPKTKKRQKPAVRRKGKRGDSETP